MTRDADVLIIGGGLAGLTAGIALSRRGRKVSVFEKHQYPRHKVCGEYLSREVLPVLDNLGIDLHGLGAIAIDRLTIVGRRGQKLSCELPLGGVGISRYTLDHDLYQAAIQQGCTFVFDEVIEVSFDADRFTVTAKSGAKYNSKIVLGAYGKKSAIDNKLNRSFTGSQPQWLAVKAHYKAKIDRGAVGLYLFPGGYCGVSGVEGDKVNICYLASYKEFSRAKSPEAFTREVVAKNPALGGLLESAKLDFAKQLAISNISFGRKSRVENHILMLGDSAQMIHPLSGNGMAMAIGSAEIAIPLADAFLRGEISRNQMEHDYARKWNNRFLLRIRAGRIISPLMLNRRWSSVGINILSVFPFLLPTLVSMTHGNHKTDFSRRSSLPEMMDDFAMEGNELRDALDKIATINRFLGGNRVTLQGVASLVRSYSGTLKIVDFGCGNGDMLRQIARWGRRNKIKMQLVGVDANAFTVNVAREQSQGFDEIRYECFDFLKQTVECDIALFTLTLHHFPDDVLLDLIERTRKNSRLGIVINDLHRSPVAFRLFKIVCRAFGLNRMSRQDGLVSIQRGFTRKDLENYAEKLDIQNPNVEWKWAFRYRWVIKNV